MSFDSEAKLLGTLEAIDPRVFAGDDKVSQSVCDFVLALAVVYNDVRDVMFARVLLANVAPPDAAPLSPTVGLSRGLLISLIRLHAGIYRELLELVAESEKEIGDPAFQRLLARLPKPSRKGWSSLVAAAAGKPASDPMAKALVFYRNKIAFHYDKKEIQRGFALSFNIARDHKELALSRGNSTRERRFYFADAAAESYLRYRGADDEVDTFLRGGGEPRGECAAGAVRSSDALRNATRLRLP
jgi:hypothetical protein